MILGLVVGAVNDHPPDHHIEGLADREEFGREIEAYTGSPWEGGLSGFPPEALSSPLPLSDG
jgi:hypothetical protein